MLIVKMRQFQQVAIWCGRRANEMGEHGAIILLPARLVQHVTAQFLHIACIVITDIYNKCAAWTQVSMHCLQCHQLFFACDNMSERAKCNKRQAKLLLKMEGDNILLHQRTMSS